MGNSAKRDVGTVTRAERLAKAWSLRVEGLSIRAIATQLKLAPSHVHKLLSEERIELTAEAMEEVAAHKATLIAREEALIETHWPMRQDPDSAKVVQASNKMIAALTGSLAPARSELTGKDGGPLETANTSDEILRRLALLAASGGTGESDPKP